MSTNGKPTLPPSYTITDALSVLFKIAERSMALEKQVRKLKNENAALKHASAEHDHKIFCLENDVATKTTYRGIWKPDTHYQPCDEVTRGGRVWHANIATADKPGTSSAWRMKDKEDSERG